MNTQLVGWIQIVIGVGQLGLMLFQLRGKDTRRRRVRRRTWKGFGVEYTRHDDDHQL